MTGIIVLSGIGILTLMFFLIPTKVSKIETDFKQILLDIEESQSIYELEIIGYEITDFVQLYWGRFGKHNPKLIREALSKKTTELLNKKFTPLININEPSK